jgi:hypothetical protein
MLGTATIENVLNTLNLLDFDFTVEEQDTFGDFVKVFSPELSFDMVKATILKTKRMTQNIVDISPYAILISCKDTYKGYNYYYDLKIVSGKDFGTRFLAGVKRIDYYTNEGAYKPFIGFEMMDSYIKSYEIQKD